LRLESHSNDTAERNLQLEKHFSPIIPTEAGIEVALHAEHQEKSLVFYDSQI
jgi:hypothetical protein